MGERANEISNKTYNTKQFSKVERSRRGCESKKYNGPARTSEWTYDEINKWVNKKVESSGERASAR